MMYHTRFIAEPCRNFTILGSAYIPEDPKDGKERYAIASYAGGGRGTLILIDAVEHTSESFPFPSDEGAWAVCYLADKGLLLIGTCAHGGMLHRFSLKDRTYISSLPLKGERYFWNLSRAENGKVYGGSWPSGVLAEYDPETEILTNLGHVGDDAENCYTKNVMPVPGGVIVTSGFNTTQVWRWLFQEKRFTRVGGEGETGIFTTEDCILSKNDSKYFLYDSRTLALISTWPLTASPDEMPAPAPIREHLADLASLPFGLKPGESGSHIAARTCGERIGIKGQDLVWTENGEWKFMQIPADPIPCNMMTVSAAPDGMIWGSAEFGQTIFHYDPKTGEYASTSSVAAAGGEVYGIVHKDNKIFLTSYVGGDHILYDPSLPWNQYENKNPRQLGSSAPDMIRPHGRSVLGCDGNVWTGWWASYGVRGGGITCIDTKTLEVKAWFQIADGQAIENLAAGPDCLYAVTSGEASGLIPESACFQTLKIDMEGRVIKRHVWEKGVYLSKVLYLNGCVVVSRTDLSGTKSILSILDPETLEIRHELTIATFSDTQGERAARELANCGDGLCAAFLNGKAVICDPKENRIVDTCETLGSCQTASLAPDGNVYFAIGEKLCVLSKDE